MMGNRSIFGMLSLMSTEDIEDLFDTGYFNKYAKGYLRKAVTQLVDEGTLEEDQGDQIKERYQQLLDKLKASEV